MDGSTEGNFAIVCGSITNPETQAWWAVDWGAVYSIANIDLWNRSDCCANWLGDVYILVSEQPFSSNALDATLAQPGVSAYYIPSMGGTPTNLTIGRLGRYVRVQLTQTTTPVLSLAEVQVWATGGAITTPTPTSTPQPERLH